MQFFSASVSFSWKIVPSGLSNDGLRHRSYRKNHPRGQISDVHATKDLRLIYYSFHLAVDEESLVALNSFDVWPDGSLFRLFLGKLPTSRHYMTVSKNVSQGDHGSKS